MKAQKVGVKSPEAGTPPEVAGIAVRALAVEVGVGLNVGVSLGVGVGVSRGVGVGVGVLVGVRLAEGVAVKAGKPLASAAKTVNVRVNFLPR